MNPLSSADPQRAVAYRRVSSAEQGEPRSLTRVRGTQPERRCRALEAQQHGPAEDFLGRQSNSGRRLRIRDKRALLFSTHHPKASLLRSRLSILLMLVVGFVFSSAGVGHAVTGVADEDQSAAAAQYAAAAPRTPGPPGDSGVAGEASTLDGPDQPEAPVEEARQLGAE